MLRATVDPTAGVSLSHRTHANIDAAGRAPRISSCPPSSDEVDPSDLDANGNPLKEEIYVDYDLSAGKAEYGTIILFDPHAGPLSNTIDPFYSPQAAWATRCFGPWSMTIAEG